MKKTLKNLILVMAMAVLCMAMAVTASALNATGQCGNNVYWAFDESSGELVISGEGKMWDYNGLSPFSSINIKNVVIEKGVTTIGKYSFYQCKELVSVKISEGVTGINYSAFAECSSLKDVIIPESLTIISSSSFACTGITDIYIPNAYIELWAFQNCSSLKSLKIGKGVPRIDIGLPDSLEKITVDKNNENYSSDEFGTLFNKDKTILIDYASGNPLTSYSIPEGVIEIYVNAFSYSKNLINIILPESLKKIESCAFSHCFNLESLYIPSNVNHIDEDAFNGTCYNLKEIIVDQNNEFYSNDEFGVLFNKDKTNLLQYPSGSSMKSYIIPDSVITISSSSFAYSQNLENITIGKNMTAISGSSITYCEKLRSVIIPKGITEIGNTAFGLSYRLSNIFYEGTKQQWDEIDIDEHNPEIFNATIHYSVENPDTHYNLIITPPTCIEQGYTTYICDCGYCFTSDYINVLKHKDNNGDYTCDYGCGYKFEIPTNPDTPNEPYEEKNFFEKIKDFFKQIIDWFKNLFN